MRKVKFSQKAAPTSSAMDNGAAHVRYGHKTTPTLIDVVCSKCGMQATAKLISEEAIGVVASDLNPAVQKDRWSVACRHCTYRMSSVPKNEVTPFFWEFEAAGCRVWAWNEAHLGMLASVLLGESIGGHSYECLRTYIHKEWLLKRNRLRIAKEIANRIANKPLQVTALTRRT